MKNLNVCFWIFASVLCAPFIGGSQNIYDTLRTVKMTATVNQQAKNINIEWEDDPGSNTYYLYKKLRQDTTWGDALFVSDNQTSNFLDTNIDPGKLYEYRILKETGDSLGYAYLFSGVNYLPPQRRGNILLLVDSAAVNIINTTLTKYIDVLTSEGWLPALVCISENATVQEVKSLIIQYHTSLDSLTSALLMGNIAVPHSGNINPDGHSDHKGAWPADVYYGDIDGIWTDEIVNNSSSAYPRLHNIPGDGNFDQAFIPSDIELVIGRLDFSELPVFDDNEYLLLKNYLQKNIAFRTGEYRVNRRAVFTNINPWKEGLGQNAIRNFVPLVSNDSLEYNAYFDAYYDSFLWSYGASSGSMINSNGLGSIYTYVDNNFQAVFTANFGSYFGDYDYENNYLRTLLGSGKVLSSVWMGAPNWYFHPMGMGFDLGFCSRLTQNNSDVYYAGYFPKSVTLNLLGDPTLKAFIVTPPKDLEAIQEDNQVELSWTSSADALTGYQVYRKNESMLYFEPLDSIPITETSFIDACVTGSEQVEYLVKAVKQEITPSGSFINHSCGPIISVLTLPNVLPEAIFNVSYDQGILKGLNSSINADQFEWILPNGVVIYDENFELDYNGNGETAVTLIASNACYSDTLEQVITITDLSDLKIEKSISVYPNPSIGNITLETNLKIDAIHMYDLLGHLLWTETSLAIGKHAIDIQNIKQGNLILKIHINNKIVSRLITVDN